MEPNYQSYIVRLRGAERDQRDELLNAMQARGIATRRGLMAAHLEPCYQGHPLRWPLSHSVAAEAQTFVLPMYTELTEADQEHVVAQLRSVVGELFPEDAT